MVMKSFVLLLSIMVVGVVLYLPELCQGSSSPILLGELAILWRIDIIYMHACMYS